MSEAPDGEYTFVCPECGETLVVNESMKEVLIENSCVICGAALTAAAFASGGGREAGTGGDDAPE